MLLGLFPRFDVILLSQVIWGVGSTFLSGASQAWISDEIGEEKANRSFLIASQYGKIGSLIGIGVCIALATIDLRLPIILGSLGLVLIGLFSFFFMDERPFRPVIEENRQTWLQLAGMFVQGFSLVRSYPVLWIFIVIAMFEGMYSEGYDRLFAPFLVESFEFPVLVGFDMVIWWGVMSAGSTVLAFAAVDIVRRFIDTSNYRHLVTVLTIASVLLVASTFSFALAGNFYIALLAYFGVAMLRSVKDPLFTALLNQNLESTTRATVFSMQAQADALGQIGGGPTIGVVGKFVSIQAALITSTIALIPVVGLYRLALWEKQGHNMD